MEEKESRKMAKSLASHPWDPDSGVYAQKCVSDNEYLLNALTANLTAIVTSVDLSDNFWTLLLQHGVVDTDTMRRIQAKKTPIIHAQALMLHIMEVQVYKFHGFIWALVNSHQCHLAELLGFAVRDYLDVEVYFMSSALLCPACHEFYTKAYILTGCGHYVCAPCVKGAKFICKQNQKEDVTCPVPECGKVTEASPSAGNIGLKEDGDFGDLCQAVLNMTTKQTAESKGQEQDKLSQQLQGVISDLEHKVSYLKKYTGVLEKYDLGVQAYIKDSVERNKQKMDEWAKENQVWSASICHQVEENLHKSVKWQKAASELAVVVRARPGFLEECLEDKVQLPEETLTDEAEKLLTNLEAGCPIPLLLTPLPHIFHGPASVPPAKAKFLSTLGQYPRCYKVAWMPDSSVMVLTDADVWRMKLNIDTLQCIPTLIRKGRCWDLSVAVEGTWILSTSDGIVEIHYPGLKEAKPWRQAGMDEPYNVFINNRNIFVGGYNSPTIRSASRELVFVDEYDIGANDNDGYIHVTERGTLMKSSRSDCKVYTMDLETKEVSSFGRKGTGGGQFNHPAGFCTVNDDEYVLVCDYRNNRVSVFTHDGRFIHHLDVEGGVQRPYTIAVLGRKRKPSLMALYLVINRKPTVSVYSLN